MASNLIAMASNTGVVVESTIHQPWLTVQVEFAFHAFCCCLTIVVRDESRRICRRRPAWIGFLPVQRPARVEWNLIYECTKCIAPQEGLIPQAEAVHFWSYAGRRGTFQQAAVRATSRASHGQGRLCTSQV